MHLSCTRIMRLLTHNMLTSHVKGVTDGYPLIIEVGHAVSNCFLCILLMIFWLVSEDLWFIVYFSVLEKLAVGSNEVKSSF